MKELRPEEEVVYAKQEQYDAEALIRSLLPGVTILPSSSRSDYATDEDYERAMKKHHELAALRPSKLNWNDYDVNGEW
jgi:hypothetical protein